MGSAPEDLHAAIAKPHACDAEPFCSDDADVLLVCRKDLDRRRVGQSVPKKGFSFTKRGQVFEIPVSVARMGREAPC